MNRPIYLSHAEKQIIAAVRMFGSLEVHARDWRMFERMVAANRIHLSEPHGKDDLWRTATIKYQEE